MAAAVLVAGSGAAVAISRSALDRSPATVTVHPAEEGPGEGYEERPGGVVVPTFVPPDGGVIVSASQVRQDEPVPWTAMDDYAPTGMVVGVDSCALRAPGRWEIRGTITNPLATDTRARVRLGLPGPMGSEAHWVAWDVVARGSGAFALGADMFAELADEAREQRLVPSSPLYRFSCYVGAQSPDVAVTPAANGGYVDPTYDEGVAEYRAPEGTTQALGIGARLSDDPRYAWALVAWAGRALPFEEIWVPELSGTGRSMEIAEYRSANSFCRQVDQVLSITDVKSVVVRQESECDLLGRSRRTRGDAVEGADGFLWYEQGDGFPLSARRVDGAVVVDVSGHDRESIAAVTRSLRRVSNGVVTPPVAGGPMSADLDTAIRNALAPEGYTERTRLPYRGDGWLVVAIQQKVHGTVTSFTVVRSASGWVATHTGGSTSWGPCLTPFGWSEEAGTTVLAVAADPSHGLEEETAGGTWVRRDTEDGVYYLDLPGGATEQEVRSFRAVDPGTGAVACVP